MTEPSGRWGFLRWLLVPSLERIERFSPDPSDPAEEKQRVQAFWSANPNMGRDSAAAPGTREFFQEIDASRRQSHWPLYDLVPFAQTRGRDVLEVGCGLGSDAAEYSRHGARYVGVDLTSPAATLTKKKLEAYGLPGSTVQADAERLPFRDEAFDLAYSWGVLHHTPDTQAGVDELRRTLRPGGGLILMLYYVHGWWSYRVRWHWALLSLLRVPVIAALAPALFGVPRDRVAKWRAHYRRNREALFAQLLARETDAAPIGVNPHSKVYSKREANRLLGGFTDVRMQAAHWIEAPSVERAIGRPLYRRLLTLIGRLNGPCLYVFAHKLRSCPLP